MTANNPDLGTQVMRRCVRCRLDAKVEQPWLRDGWRHPDLRGWARDHRGELVWSALVLIQNWVAKGRPQGARKLGKMGSYDGWAQIMGGILAAAGIGGFLENQQRLYNRADSQAAAWRALIALWRNTHGDKPVKVSELYELINLNLDTWDWGRATSEHSQKVSLGTALAAREGYTITVTNQDGSRSTYVITRGQQDHQAQTWRLLEPPDQEEI